MYLIYYSRSVTITGECCDINISAGNLHFLFGVVFVVAHAVPRDTGGHISRHFCKVPYSLLAFGASSLPG